MRERIAKRLCILHGEEPSEAYNNLAGEVIGYRWQDFLVEVDEILAAMLEPTDEMYGDAVGDAMMDGDPTAVWQAMIKAAMKERGE